MDKREFEVKANPQKPERYVIRKEAERLLPSGYKYVAYMEDGTPMYLGGATPEAVAARLREGHLVESITYEGKPIDDQVSKIKLSNPGKCEIIKIHDDGDRTIRCGEMEYIQTADGKLFEEISDEETDILMLHLIEHELVGRARIVDPAKVKKSICNCFTYKGKDYCFAKGAIGMLTGAQSDEYCEAGKTYKVKSGMRKRFETFRQCAEAAREKVKELSEAERIEPWFEEIGIAMGEV